MRLTMLIFAVPPALLAGCNGPPQEKAANGAAAGMTAEAVQAQVEKVQLKPGLWEGRFVMESVDMPGAQDMPASAGEQMKRAMTRTLRYCVTPDQAAHPDGRAFSGEAARDCSYAGFEAQGGTVKGSIACRREGATTTMAMTGTYAPGSYAMHMDMTQAGLPNGMEMRMTARSEGKWIGPDCKGV